MWSKPLLYLPTKLQKIIEKKLQKIIEKAKCFLDYFLTKSTVL